MSGLILKDLLNLRRYLKMYLILLGIYCVLFFNISSYFILSMSALLFGMLIVSTFSYDTRARWDKYACSFPVEKKDIVLAKYLTALIFDAIGLALGFVLTLILGMVRQEFQWRDCAASLAVSLSIVLFFHSVLIPLVYKFGEEKARIMIIIVLLLPAGIALLGANLLKNVSLSFAQGNFMELWIEWGAFFVPLAMLLLFFLSYFISAKIYEKKEIG